MDHASAGTACEACMLNLPHCIKPLKLLRDEHSIFTDQLAVKVNFAAAVVWALDLDEVPVDGAAVFVVGFLVGLAEGHVEAAGDFFVEEDVARGVGG
jgi:hypothetical protein